eukprot:scaffold31563_cov27-Tisochrysis_lutea.AAC.2
MHAAPECSPLPQCPLPAFRVNRNGKSPSGAAKRDPLSLSSPLSAAHVSFARARSRSGPRQPRWRERWGLTDFAADTAAKLFTESVWAKGSASGGAWRRA